MRIISGKYRGRTIVPPRNLRARPTTDFAKENLFNVLTNIVDFEELDVLDLFSGTGSISYEFASRDARSVTSVEVNSVHHNFIRQTARELKFENFYAVKANVFLYLKSCSKKFDIIFMDHMMPGMDGIETLKHIRAEQNSPCADTPVIVLTANAIEGSRETYLEAGFDGYLSKPIATEELMKMIAQYLPEEKIELQK